MVARYADTPTAQLAAELGRQVSSVYTLADRLGLKKSPEWRVWLPATEYGMACQALMFADEMEEVK